MNWREFKHNLTGLKGFKGFSPKPDRTLEPSKPLKPTEVILNNVPTPRPDFNRLIGETLAEIDAAGRPWDGWLQSLTREQRRELVEIEHWIEDCNNAHNWPGTVEALDNYRDFCLRGRQ